MTRSKTLRMIGARGIVACVVLGAAACPSLAQNRAVPAIAVGANTHVSVARATHPHNEVVIAADPTHAGWLLACSMLDPGTDGSMKTAAYVSHDGGTSWTAPSALLTTTFWANDPTCAFGPDGAAYVVHKANDGEPRPHGVRSDGDYLVVHRSEDGGRTWSSPVRGPQANDRPFMAVDTHGANRRGRLYVAYNGHLHGEGDAHDNENFRNTVVVQASADGGRSFVTHAEVGLMDQSAAHVVNAGIAGATVLSDGSVAVLYAHMIMGGQQKGSGKLTELDDTLTLVRSIDGGASFQTPVRIAAIKSGYNLPSSRGVPASLAVDPGSARFPDRLYVAWAEYSGGVGRIQLSWSADSGQHWSAPRMVSDDSAGANGFMATVAVSHDGVVGVMWYDRRDVADANDYRPRFAASIDGGDTWSPSAAVSTSANAVANRRGGSAFYANGGDTAGLAAGADGRFHALWIDNRTGVQQVWTAAITITTRK
jgi:hypothetical protein